jgi:hypothetical protein
MRTVTFGMLALSIGVTPAMAAPLEGDALKNAVAGKRVYLSIPFGGEFPLYYRSNGVVDGTSPTSLLARLDPKTDSGRWWVSGDKLCQQWKLWYEGQRHCFTLESTGPNALKWVRQEDGLSGKARVE